MTKPAPKTKRFNRIVSEAARLKLPGHWYAGAHGYHPRGVIRRPYILTDRWNTNGYCSAHVLTALDAELEEPLDAPRSHHGRTFPRPKTGEAIAVYDTGRWLADGPWQEQLPILLDVLEAEVEAALQKEREAKDAAALKRKAEQDARLAAARKAACDGFEVAPGVRSGCSAKDTGADDCPVCGDPP